MENQKTRGESVDIGKRFGHHGYQPVESGKKAAESGKSRKMWWKTRKYSYFLRKAGRRPPITHPLESLSLFFVMMATLSLRIAL